MFNLRRGGVSELLGTVLSPKMLLAKRRTSTAIP